MRNMTFAKQMTSLMSSASHGIDKQFDLNQQKDAI